MRLGASAKLVECTSDRMRRVDPGPGTVCQAGVGACLISLSVRESGELRLCFNGGYIVRLYRHQHCLRWILR